jgi:hypothetical protein
LVQLFPVCLLVPLALWVLLDQESLMHLLGLGYLVFQLYLDCQ